LVQHLAHIDRIPLVRGESTAVEEVDAMLEHGITHEEIAALFVARNMAYWDMTNSLSLGSQIYHQAAAAGIAGFREYTEAEKQILHDSGREKETITEMATQAQQMIPILNGLYRPAVDGADLFFIDSGAVQLNPKFAGNVAEISMDKLSWQGSSRINEVVRLDIEIRDRAIFRNILQAYDQGKSPFVDYGGSHVVCLEPALRAYAEAA
jgi:hypothetical protein